MVTRGIETIFHEMCPIMRGVRIYWRKKQLPPHEDIFIKELNKELFIKKNLELTIMFEIFIHQFYPDFDIKNKDLNNGMLFGDIATDFLIRYRNYSLVGCSG